MELAILVVVRVELQSTGRIFKVFIWLEEVHFIS